MKKSIVLQSSCFFVGFFFLQREHEEARKRRVLPSTDQVPLLQLQVDFVLFFQVEQNSIGGRFTSHVFVTRKGRNDWFPIQHQVHLDDRNNNEQYEHKC